MALDFEINTQDITGGRYIAGGLVFSDPAAAHRHQQEIRATQGNGSGISGHMGVVAEKNAAVAQAGYRSQPASVGRAITGIVEQSNLNVYDPFEASYNPIHTSVWANNPNIPWKDQLNFGPDYWQQEAGGGLEGPSAVSNLQVAEDGTVVNGDGVEVTAQDLLAAEHDQQQTIGPPKGGTYTDGYYAELDAGYDRAKAQMNTVREAYKDGTLDIENVPPGIRQSIHDAYVREQVDSGEMTHKEASNAFNNAVNEGGLNAIDPEIVNQGFNNYQEANIDGAQMQKELMQTAPLDQSNLLPPSPTEMTTTSGVGNGADVTTKNNWDQIDPSTGQAYAGIGNAGTATMKSAFNKVGSTPVPDIAPKSEIVAESPAPEDTYEVADAGTTNQQPYVQPGAAGPG
ncbi:MAG: hypothetical protein AAF569_07290 [Pseudomonadota bacterium]